MRALAASSPGAIAAISDSANRPSACAMSAMRGSACITAKLESGALAAIRSASSNALARPAPASTRYCEKPIAQPFVGVVDAAGQHHVGHPRGADQARDARRAAAADEDAALALGQAVEGALLGDADVAARGQLEAAADHRAMQHRDHRHAAELDLLERRVPGARMHDAFGDAALAESSDRSSPAQKCSPSPLSTTARTASGRLTKAVCSCATSASLIALRLAGPVQAHVQDGAARSRRSRSSAEDGRQQCRAVPPTRCAGVIG